jgi:2-iminobutanoate/2-iminopropanoate deaminase
MTVERKIIAPATPGPASPAVRGGDFIFVSGLVATDPTTGATASGTVVSELTLILQTLQSLLESAGSSMSKVAKVNIFLYSMLEFPAIDGVYRKFFPENPPARTVCGTRVPDGFKVVVECTALA